MSPVCVARSMIIYEMFKNGSDVDTIFELWYLSCISKETCIELQKAIKSILDSKRETLQEEIIGILKYWQDHKVSVKDS